MATMTVTVDGGCTATQHTAKQQLYSEDGVPKRAGDAPLGIAYDADGLPVPDWEVEGENEGARDATGRRRAPRVKGAVQLKDYVKYVRRATPTWGKKFGEVTKPRVGRFGAFTADEAKLCLLTETFGWKLGEDAPLAPTPPYVRLCYGELHGEQESLRIFTEIHLLKTLDVTQVHAMVQSLGYISYCVPDGSGARPR